MNGVLSNSAFYLIVISVLLIANMKFVRPRTGCSISMQPVFTTIRRCIVAQVLWLLLITILTMLICDSINCVTNSPLNRAFLNPHPAATAIVVAYFSVVFNTIVFAVLLINNNHGEWTNYVMAILIATFFCCFSIWQLLRR